MEHIHGVLLHLLGVFKVQVGSFRGKVHAAGGITSPAVVASIPEVVRVGISSLLGAVVARAVEPVLALETLRALASDSILV